MILENKSNFVKKINKTYCSKVKKHFQENFLNEGCITWRAAVFDSSPLPSQKKNWKHTVSFIVTQSQRNKVLLLPNPTILIHSNEVVSISIKIATWCLCSRVAAHTPNILRYFGFSFCYVVVVCCFCLLIDLFVATAVHSNLTHCGLATPYSDKELSQHWFR